MPIVATITANAYELTGLSKINVVLGKNGCGRSSLLTGLDAFLAPSNEPYGLVRYITPERGGNLLNGPNVESNMLSTPSWITHTRRQNQACCAVSPAVDGAVPAARDRSASSGA